MQEAEERRAKTNTSHTELKTMENEANNPCNRVVQVLAADTDPAIVEAPAPAAGATMIKSYGSLIEIMFNY